MHLRNREVMDLNSFSLAPFGFHICYSFDVKYLQTDKFHLM